jgi:hypothetical protein
LLDPFADPGQHDPERQHAFVFGFIAHLAPPWVITALLAPAGIAACHLQVTIGRRADPDVLPCRWDHQAADARESGSIFQRLVIEIEIAEGFAVTLATVALLRVADVAETGILR